MSQFTNEQRTMAINYIAKFPNLSYQQIISDLTQQDSQFKSLKDGTIRQWKNRYGSAIKKKHHNRFTNARIDQVPFHFVFIFFDNHKIYLYVYFFCRNQQIPKKTKNRKKIRKKNNHHNHN